MKLRISLLLCAVVFATGCPKPKYGPSINFEQGMVDKFNTALKEQYHRYECYRFGVSTDSQGKACTGFSQDLTKAKEIRNELLENALPYIDESYMSFVMDLQAGRDRNNYVLDLVDLGAAAAVGITNGERSLQVIGVALTAFRGGRKSLDANFYKDTSTPILISKMDGNRANVRSIILQREKLEVSDYSMGAAVADIVDYYNAGTLVRAFTQLQEDTAVLTQQSVTHLTNLKAAGVKRPPTAEELRISNENAAALRTLRKAYKDADKKITDSETKISNGDQAITDAGTAITDADQRIGAATAQIAAATTNTAKATARAVKATAEADKVKAEAKKTTGAADKTAGETTKATAVTERDAAYKKLQGIYEAIANDPKLGPLLNTVPDADPNIQPPRKTALQGMLQRNKNRQAPTTDAERNTAVDEYATILHEFAAIVLTKFKDEPELNTRLQEILKANK